MKKEYFVFDVDTYYKNGEVKNECITATDETSMWKIYDERHSHEVDLIETSAITDNWAE